MKPAVIPPVVVSCQGEDGDPFTMLKENWLGSETDFSPGSTDYDLSGRLRFGDGVWMVDEATGRGMFTANARLRDESSGALLYSGSIVLITQTSVDGQIALARGWIA
jgi:hypothetical protein